MKKKAQLGFFSLMMAIVFFALGLALAPALNDVIQDDNVRGVDGYDCANESLDYQYEVYCTQTDLISPFFIGIVFGLAGMLLVGMAQ